MRLSWMIGGAQGMGVDTSANIFGNAVARAGYYIYGNREYYSNIKGRHSYFNITISDKMVNSISHRVNILASFDAETVFQHFNEVSDFIIYDTELESTKAEMVKSMEWEITERVMETLKGDGLGTTVKDAVEYAKKRGVKVIPVRYNEVLKKVADAFKVPLSAVERSRNMIAAAVSYSLLGLDKELLMSSIKDSFKNETFVKYNTMAVEEGLKLAQNVYNLKRLEIKGHRVQLDGNTISAMGKLAGGLRFQSYYPITPASDESVYIEANQLLDMKDPKTGDTRKGGIVVIQSEDELAAVNMAIGSALTGVRSATATSGPGFSLMAEGISWAGMNEVPVVVTYYMRGAPSTGLPTRSGQADLEFALNAGHGEFPKIVLASGDHVEIFHDAIWALNLAEKYQTPVIHVIEKALANAYSVFDEELIDYSKDVIERGEITDKAGPRFQITENGISPRGFLGKVSELFYTGDEHNIWGHITEDSENRKVMYEKRMKKLDTADKEIPEEQRVNIVGDGDIALLTWGSPRGAILDIMDELKQEGINVQMIQVKMFSPFPTNLVKKTLSNKRKIIAIENNYLAQGARVTALHTGIYPTNYILKWTGRIIMRDELLDAIKKVVKDDVKKVVLDAGA
ncbi:2-oxoacid:ferredoxin oxidoreductase subunit alpha [Sulfolobales archaeon HS-7]|nr:2-oxoacid:ferredoxin oxidoreductase subunit alpha [Sulfolobales archaeon HS-7]